MSIINLEFSGQKNIDINCSNLEVLGETILKNVEVQGGIMFPDPLMIDVDIEMKKDVAIGTISNNNILIINSKNILINDNAEISLQDNNVNALKIIANTKDLLVVDTTTSSEKFTYDSEIIVNNNNVNIVDGEILVNSAKLLNSIGRILISQGTHIWTSAQTVGTNVLVISGLDGDVDKGYMLLFKFDISSTNLNFFLKMNINNDVSAEYATALLNNGMSSFSNNQTQLSIVDFNSSVRETGSGNLSLFTDRTTNSIISGHSDLASKQIGLGNNPSVISKSIYYENTGLNNIISIEIDVFNTNQNGSTFQYKLYKNA